MARKNIIKELDRKILNSSPDFHELLKMLTYSVLLYPLTFFIFFVPGSTFLMALIAYLFRHQIFHKDYHESLLAYLTLYWLIYGLTLSFGIYNINHILSLNKYIGSNMITVVVCPSIILICYFFYESFEFFVHRILKK